MAESLGAKKTRSLMPKKNSASADRVMTDVKVATSIVAHFGPEGNCLDPCYGQGAFVDALLAEKQRVGKVRDIYGCELSAGADFLRFNVRMNARIDWIVSNPPYSILREWLVKSYAVANDIVYLVQAPRPFFTALLRDAEQHEFGIKEMCRIETPKDWRKVMSPFGGGYAAVHWQRGWDMRRDGARITRLESI